VSASAAAKVSLDFDKREDSRFDMKAGVDLGSWGIEHQKRKTS